MAVRVAEALDLLTELRIPWLFETPAIHAGQVSMAHLDEYKALVKMSFWCPITQADIMDILAHGVGRDAEQMRTPEAYMAQLSHWSNHFLQAYADRWS